VPLVLAARSKEDRQPYLEQPDAHDLLVQALTLYRHENGNFPARVVLHKTSRFNDAEKAGFNTAADDLHVDQIELVLTLRLDPRRTILAAQLRDRFRPVPSCAAWYQCLGCQSGYQVSNVGEACLSRFSSLSIRLRSPKPTAVALHRQRVLPLRC
jgi:hypothetical protein